MRGAFLAVSTFSIAMALFAGLVGDWATATVLIALAVIAGVAVLRSAGGGAPDDGG